MKLNTRVMLLCGAATSAFAMAADAQTSGGEEEPIFLDTIVLEQTRLRSERLQDAPVAATVVEGESLVPGRSNRLADAVQSAPNVSFNNQGGPLTIRGITSGGISNGVDRQSAVGLFVDGVFIPRPFSYRPFLFDLDQVEIARGSQATLLGRNTIGGAINLATREPDGSTGGELTFSVNDNGDLVGVGSYQTSLSDSFSARATLAYTKSDGYIRNASTDENVNDADELFGRVVVVGDIGDSTVRFSADYNRDNGDGGLWYAPIEDALDFKADHDFVPENKRRNGGMSLRVDRDLGGVEFMSISAVRKHTLETYLDGDFTAADSLGQGQVEDQIQYSQEFRLASFGDNELDWIAGFFAFYEDFEASQSYDLTSNPRDQWSSGFFDQKTLSLALYGSVDWEFAPNWEVSSGLRFTRDTKDTRSEITDPSGSGFFGATGVAEAEQTFTNLSPELSLRYELSDESSAYIRLASGYKSGGISPFLEADGSANVYDPEETTSAELGYRFESADGRFSFGATGFWTEWENQQVRVQVTPTVRVFRNAAESRSRGIELEATAAVSDTVSVRGAYGFTNATYTDYQEALLGADYSGNRLVYTPEHTLSLGVEWRNPLANGTEVFAGLSYQYQSGFFFNPDNAYEQEATHLVDLNVGVDTDSWRLELYADNVLDERYLDNFFDFGTAQFGDAAPGRTIGINATARF